MPHPILVAHADLFWASSIFRNRPILDQEPYHTCNGTVTLANYRVSQPQYVIVNHDPNEAFLLGAFGAAFADTALEFERESGT